MNSSEIKIVPKGWGYEKWIVNTEEYCGKILFFEEGKRCSWHYHKLKDETFYLQSGKLLLYYGDTDSLEGAKDIVLVPGDKFHIYRGLRHQRGLPVRGQRTITNARTRKGGRKTVGVVRK